MFAAFCADAALDSTPAKPAELVFVLLSFRRKCFVVIEWLPVDTVRLMSANVTTVVIMVTLCNRADHYIFAL